MKAGSKKRPERLVMAAVATGQLNIFDMFPEKQLDGKRTLPYLSLEDSGPISEGFIFSSIEQGLNLGDILLMSQVKRNNVDKKHNASERSGYLQRKLTKLQEDVTLRHDGTVRDSKDKIIQLVYGDDGFSPVHCYTVTLHTCPLSESDLEKHRAVMSAMRNTPRDTQLLKEELQ